VFYNVECKECSCLPPESSIVAGEKSTSPPIRPSSGDYSSPQYQAQNQAPEEMWLEVAADYIDQYFSVVTGLLIVGMIGGLFYMSMLTEDDTPEDTPKKEMKAR
jgi:hypothetical protein